MAPPDAAKPVLSVQETGLGISIAWGLSMLANIIKLPEIRKKFLQKCFGNLAPTTSSGTSPSLMPPSPFWPPVAPGVFRMAFVAARHSGTQ
jgi:hypothetical protein